MSAQASPSPAKKCFVISPIGAKDSPERKAADKVLKHLIKKSLGDEYVIHRADESANPGAITPAMVAAILEADLIVADLTGHNPNVFYELAMAHGYGRPTVHIQKVGDRIPFDVKDMRIISYDMDPDELENAQKQLREYSEFAVANPEKVETPLTNAQAFAAINESTDPAVESNVLIMEAIRSLRQEVRRALPARARVVSPSANRSRADLRALREVVESVVQDGRAEAADFTAVISQETSTGFDQWVVRQLAEILGTDEPTEMQFAYSPDMAAGDDEPDEDLTRGR